MPTSVLLHLDEDDEKGTVRTNLSSVALAGRFLWLGTDEGTCLERLERSGSRYAGHWRVDLRDVLDLPAGGPDDEVDVEGLAVADGALWVVGSHSARRRNPKPKDDPAEVLDKLAKLEMEPNRFVLARLPLSDEGGTVGRGALLAGGGPDNELIQALRRDRHLRGSLPRIEKEDGDEDDGKVTTVGLASKENGLDLEGLAVDGPRVFIGCRGPVLRGWAVILDARVDTSDGRGTPRIHLDGPLRKHLVDLDGLGVRDLVRDGPDLLILAGPTMDLDGPTRVYRYRDATAATSDAVARPTRLLEVPHGSGTDHAEGMDVTALPQTDTEWAGRGLLVVYDSPAENRCQPNGKGVRADIFRLPS
jgi:hypothetical protein